MTRVARALAADVVPGVAVSTDESDRVAYARDLWPRHLIDLRAGHAAGARPDAVVWPTSTEEVARVVAWCAREGVPIVPFGAGSGVCGGVLPDARTIVLDMKKMSRWGVLDAETPTLEVGAGAMGVTLEEDLQRRGFTIGHFPSSILCSTVGGWIAARGAGQCSGRYGKIEDMVVDLELVDGRGEVARHRRRVLGPSVVPLVIGSEGVLGVVTRATMRLHPAPTARAFASWSFSSTEEGWEAMRAIFQRGIRPAIARLYDPFDTAISRLGARKDAPRGARSAGRSRDEARVREVGAGGKVLRALLSVPRVLNGVVSALERGMPGETFGAMLLLVFEGGAEETSAGVDAARAVLQARRGSDLGEGPARRWLAHRYAVSYRQPPIIRAGAFLDTMEVCTTWSKLAGLYHDVRRALGRHVFVMAHLSHAYPDGCSIYFTFAGTANSEKDAHAKYDRVWRDALDAAIAAGGTLSHHHGVGRSKAPKMGAELGLGVDVVRALRKAFDPAGVFNRGNLVADDTPPFAGARFEPPRDVTIDATSLLARAPATMKLDEIDAALAARALTLGLPHSECAMLDVTLGSWIDAGCPGSVDPWSDPVDHAVAGFDARLGPASGDGRVLTVRPCPRRAVGPDLGALVIGARGRFFQPLAAVVRVHPVGGPSRTVGGVAATTIDRSPALGADEESTLDAIARALPMR